MLIANKHINFAKSNLFNSYTQMRKRICEELADKYEVKTNRGIFEHVWTYQDVADIEIAALITCWLNISDDCESKIEYVLHEVMHDEPFKYVMSDESKCYLDDYSCLFRHIMWHNFAKLCKKLKTIYVECGSIENAVIALLNKHRTKYPQKALAILLHGETLIPSIDSSSCNNRINMFLRLMCRQKSEIDLGLWKSIPQSRLFVSCNTSTLIIAKDLGFVSKVDENYKTMVKITKIANKIFENDPARMDYVFQCLNIKTMDSIVKKLKQCEDAEE